MNYHILQIVIHEVNILLRNFKSADVLLNIELSLFPGLNSLKDT